MQKKGPQNRQIKTTKIGGGLQKIFSGVSGENVNKNNQGSRSKLFGVGGSNPPLSKQSKYNNHNYEEEYYEYDKTNSRQNLEQNSVRLDGDLIDSNNDLEQSSRGLLFKGLDQEIKQEIRNNHI